MWLKPLIDNSGAPKGTDNVARNAELAQLHQNMQFSVVFDTKKSIPYQKGSPLSRHPRSTLSKKLTFRSKMPFQRPKSTPFAPRLLFFRIGNAHVFAMILAFAISKISCRGPTPEKPEIFLPYQQHLSGKITLFTNPHPYPIK